MFETISTPYWCRTRRRSRWSVYMIVAILSLCGMEVLYRRQYNEMPQQQQQQHYYSSSENTADDDLEPIATPLIQNHSHQHRFDFASFSRSGECCHMPICIAQLVLSSHSVIVFAALSWSYALLPQDTIHKPAECRSAPSSPPPRPKIAILMTGAARTLYTPLVYESIVKNIIEPLQKKGIAGTHDVIEHPIIHQH